MSGELFSDHGDFKKCRRALLVTSVSTIMLTQLNLLSKEVDLLGLTLAVNQKTMILFAVGFIVYFMYMFVFYTRDKLTEAAYSNVTQVHQKAWNKLNNEILTLLQGTVKVKMDTVLQEKQIQELVTELLDDVSVKQLMKEYGLTDDELVRRKLQGIPIIVNKIELERVEDAKSVLSDSATKAYKASLLNLYTNFVMSEVAPPYIFSLVALGFAVWFLRGG